MIKRIIVLGNGPSRKAYPRPIETDDQVFCINHWYAQENPLTCTDWMIGEHNEAVLPVIAYKTALATAGKIGGTIWLPGLNMDRCEKIRDAVKPLPVRIQRLFTGLAPRCRWEADPKPRRPLNGSLALAVAAGMQPDELIVAGIDLYQHPGGSYNTAIPPPDYTDAFPRQYTTNQHHTHNLIADVKYIRHALESYKGKLICYGSAMKRLYSESFKQWEFCDG